VLAVEVCCPAWFQHLNCVIVDAIRKEAETETLLQRSDPKLIYEESTRQSQPAKS